MLPLLAALFVGWQDPALRAEEQAFVELSLPRTSAFPGETLPLLVRFGVEREFLRHNLLQLFTRPLDVPLQLELVGSAPDGLELLEPRPEDTGAAGAQLLHGPSFALGEAIAQAARSREETRGGRSFVVLELDRELQLSSAGRRELPGARLSFAYATRFEPDLLGTSLPLDRATGRVVGAPLVLEVQPFPVEGRPASFVDAVGHFTLRAEAEPRALAPGEQLVLTLTIEGQGNLAQLSPPRLDVLDGFHLLGLRDQMHGTTRTLRAELVLESPRVRELPAIELASFDPRTRRYSIASTRGIALEVARPESAAPQTGFLARENLVALVGAGALGLFAILWGLSRARRRRSA